jgi:hypothetical protein
MPDANVDPITCRTFGEAASLALELHDVFGPHHAVLLLDRAGRSVDLHVFADAEHRVSHAICVAMALMGWLPQVASAVLFSEVDSIAELHEDDVRLWHLLVQAFEDVAVDLLDRIQTDAERVRSLTISCDAEPVWQRLDPDWDRP